MLVEKDREKRIPYVAGTFYPEEKAVLEDYLRSTLQRAEDELLINQKKNSERDSLSKSKIKAIMLPHAGYIYSGYVAAHGFAALRLSKNFHKVNKVVLLGDSHRDYLKKATAASYGKWETPLGDIDTYSFAEQGNDIDINSEIHDYEHILEVHIPFIQTINQQIKINPILMGDNPTDLTKVILNEDDDNTIILLSTDMSHYLDAKSASKKDRMSIEAILEYNFDYFRNHENTVCSKSSLEVLLRYAKRKNLKPRLVKYSHSGEISGDNTKVVGYSSIIFYE